MVEVAVYLLGLLAGAGLTYFSVQDLRILIKTRGGLSAHPELKFRYYIAIVRWIFILIGGASLGFNCIHGLFTSNGFGDTGSGVMLIAMGLLMLTYLPEITNDINSESTLKGFAYVGVFLLAVIFSVYLTANGIQYLT